MEINDERKLDGTEVFSVRPWYISSEWVNGRKKTFTTRDVTDVYVGEANNGAYYKKHSEKFNKNNNK